MGAGLDQWLQFDDGASDLIWKTHGTPRRLSYGPESCPWRIEYEGPLYHVFSRSNNQQDIFVSDDERYLFLDTIDLV